MKMKMGDTLIEVALAIGIFAMVAITIASLVSSSMSGAQLSLETTVTREQIDAQAEALRYIHASYIAGGTANNAGEDRYVRLWRKITDFVNNPPSEALEFVPATCEELYTNEYPSLADQNAFVINVNALYELNPASKNDEVFGSTAWMNNVLVTAMDHNGGCLNIFLAAASFPRIIYRGE
ncbi:MAG: type II secretion system protein [Bacteroidales bacterium]|nr:type II secretion system protein [Bacteroidales bacterium]